MQTINVHELAPPTSVLLLSKIFNPSFFSLMLLLLYPYPCPNQFLIFCWCCPSLSMSMSQPISHLLLSNFSHNHIFVPTSPRLSSISIKGVIPIKSIETNWKSMHLIVTKDCFRVDGWSLNLAFVIDVTICVGMTLLELLLRYNIGSLSFIPFGGAPPPMS